MRCRSILIAAWVGLWAGGISGASADVFPISRIWVEGKVDRLVYGPGGRADGMILQDHTYVKFRSQVLTDPSQFRSGDPVAVRGVAVLLTPNRVMDQVAIWKLGHLTLDDSNAPIVRRPTSVPITEFKSLSDASKLLSVSVNAEGDVDRLVLTDGTVVQIPEGGYIDPTHLQLGQPISVDGVGVPLSNQKYIEAMNVLKQDRTTLISTRSGFGEAWKVKSGAIKQALLNPAGQVDGVLLTDGSAIRFYAVPAMRARDLTPGTWVKAAGPALANQLRTNIVLLASQDQVADLSSTPTRTSTQQAGIAATSPSEVTVPQLKPLKAISRIDAMLRGPQGSVGEIVLEDGTMVRVPPRLQMIVPVSVREGDAVEVTGAGAKFSSGTVIVADSITHWKG